MDSGPLVIGGMKVVEGAGWMVAATSLLLSMVPVVPLSTSSALHLVPLVVVVMEAAEGGLWMLIVTPLSSLAEHSALLVIAVVEVEEGMVWGMAVSLSISSVVTELPWQWAAALRT